jgi:hypothetical protein
MSPSFGKHPASGAFGAPPGVLYAAAMACACAVSVSSSSPASVETMASDTPVDAATVFTSDARAFSPSSALLAASMAPTRSSSVLLALSSSSYALAFSALAFERFSHLRDSASVCS